MGWWITLGILVLLAILPLGVSVRYHSEGLGLKIIAGPFRIRILPAKKKEPKPKKEKKTKKEEAPKPEKTGNGAGKPKEKGGSLLDFLPLLRVALDFLNSFRRKLRVNVLEMKLTLAGDDPCDLAVNYGRAWAALGNLMPQLERCFVIKKRNVEVACDFEASQTVIIARLDLTITLGRLIGIAVRYGVRAVKQYLKIQKIRKGGAVK